ncbi:hypothetical protein BKA62DRAFT_796499 [Auriculariales sp. MPI-PUGE-AT-0066]|nr:hypothetical protein BKA62DRAFT_796499 [Auriculariales sp. MPI-PUGE-AT-0066]
MRSDDVEEPLSIEVVDTMAEVGKSVIEFEWDETSEVVVAVDDGAVRKDVTDGLRDFEVEVDLRKVSRAPGVLEALLLELRGRLAVDGLREEVWTSVASHDAVEGLARSWGAGNWIGEMGGVTGESEQKRSCADTEEVEDKEEVGDTRVNDERAGEVEEEMVEGVRARRTAAIAVDVGGVGGTKNSTKLIVYDRAEVRAARRVIVYDFSWVRAAYGISYREVNCTCDMEEREIWLKGVKIAACERSGAPVGVPWSNSGSVFIGRDADDHGIVRIHRDTAENRNSVSSSEQFLRMIKVESSVHGERRPPGYILQRGCAGEAD